MTPSWKGGPWHDDIYQEEIKNCCRQLRLSANLAERAQTTSGETNQEFLYNLLRDEIAYRRKQRISKMINGAGFPKPYQFSQFRDEEVDFQDTCSVQSLQSLEFQQKGLNIIMYGGTGTGKTMLSICIGMRLCEEGEHKRSGTLSKFLKKLNKAEVLILDEFGYVPYDRMGSQLLFDYMSEIHEKKQVILNTNLEFSRWVNVLYDEQMTAALIGRLTHHCHLILFPGGNNRLRESSLNETYHEIAARNRAEEKDHD